MHFLKTWNWNQLEILEISFFLGLYLLIHAMVKNVDRITEYSFKFLKASKFSEAFTVHIISRYRENCRLHDTLVCLFLCFDGLH